MSAWRSVRGGHDDVSNSAETERNIKHMYAWKRRSGTLAEMLCLKRLWKCSLKS